MGGNQDKLVHLSLCSDHNPLGKETYFYNISIVNQYLLAVSEDFQPHAKQKPSCAWDSKGCFYQGTLLL